LVGARPGGRHSGVGGYPHVSRGSYAPLGTGGLRGVRSACPVPPRTRFVVKSLDKLRQCAVGPQSRPRASLVGFPGCGRGGQLDRTSFVRLLNSSTAIRRRACRAIARACAPSSLPVREHRRLPRRGGPTGRGGPTAWRAL